MAKKTAKPAGRRRIRDKLLLLVLASLGTAVVAITTLTVWRDIDRHTASETQRLSDLSRTMASVGADALAHNDRGQAFAAIRTIGAQRSVRYAVLEDTSGHVLAETGRGARLTNDVALHAGEQPTLLDLLRTSSMEITQPVELGGRRVGRLVLLTEMEGVGDRLFGGLLVTLAGAAGAALVSILLAAGLQRSITRPILGLTGAVGRVRETHDFSPIENLKSDDEVGDLIVGVNDMLGEIRTRDQALARQVETLEQQVADRTADLNVAKDAAESANHAKSDFLATMSHEIRTPMNGIMVMAEMLAGAELPARQRRYAEVIAKSGQSLLSIINDILDFSKIEAGKLDLEETSVDPVEIVEDVASLFWDKARSKGIDLAGWIDPATPRSVSGDPTRLRQIVSNLTNNAIKFTDTGGVLIKVEPAPGEPGCLKFSVQDTGIGIPKHKLGSVFGAFEQADQSTTRKYGGTGLGLAICKRLVDGMGGRFVLSSALGKGSVFAFVVPAAALEPAETWPTLAGESVVTLSGPSGRSAVARYLGSAGAAPASGARSAPLLSIVDPDTAESGAVSRPAVCVADHADPRADDLLKRGVVDLVLIQPVRRCEIVAVLQCVAAEGSLRDLVIESASSREVADRLPRFEGARVLVADDSAVNLEVALEALSRLGVTATTVENGLQARDAILSSGFDLVLMDGSMPEMDGYDATRAVRAAQGEGARTPIVALTAHVVGAGADAWRDAGMDDVLHKPFTLAALAQTLGRFLESTGWSDSAPVPIEAPAPVAPLVANDDGRAPLIDPASAVELASMAAAGRTDFVERIRRLYRETAPAKAREALTACRDGDLGTCERAAHALKSMSLNLGARRVAELAGDIEMAARDGRAPSAEVLGQLVEALGATLPLLDGGAVEHAPAAAPPPIPSPAPAPIVAPAVITTAIDADEASLLNDLREAIDAEALTAVYQPQVDRTGEMVVGVEALVRWTHETRGSVSPALFIPVAERHGLVERITAVMVSKVCQETVDWPVTVGFNASALEFPKDDFIARITRAIDESGYDPARLEVEITETAILTDHDAIVANMRRLQAMGVKIALDDFGAGYSSLNHLRLFPFDKLKIDRDFIVNCTDAQSATIVHAVVSIGRALGMKVCAEGVETEMQRQFLKVAGVHLMQGWLFGKPVPAAELRERLMPTPAPKASLRRPLIEAA